MLFRKIAHCLFGKKIKSEIDQYIIRNYVAEYVDKISLQDDSITKGDSSEQYGKGLDLSEVMQDLGISFHDMLFQKIDESKMTEVQIYKRANIDRKFFSKIRSNPVYHPRKQTVLALAIALELNLEDTIDFLARAEYAFSPSNKGDLIIKYFIEHKVYDINTINFALYEYGQPILE